MSTFDTYESSNGRDGTFSYSAARVVSLGVLRTLWPWIYSRITGAASAEFIANGSLKKQASTEAGVACSTFMRWQARTTSIRARVERAAGMFQQKHLRDDAERTKPEETESVMLQEPKKINVRQLTDQWIEEIRADLSPNLSEENRGKIVSARLNEQIRATMAADPEFEQAFIQSELENDVCYVQALIREYVTDTRLVDPEDPEVLEATLIENALWALAEIEGSAEQLKLLRELFEKLQSALPSAVGSPFVNLILTPIIRRLKEAIVDLQEYFRTKYYDNYNATFRPQTSYIEAVIDQFIMSYYLFDVSFELESRTSNPGVA